MKSSILMIGFLFIMSISISGQTKFANSMNKDLKPDTVNLDILDKNHYSDNLNHPFVYSSSNLRKEPGFIHDLNHERSGDFPQDYILNHDFKVVSEFQGGYRNFDNMPVIKPDMNGKLRIIKPDTTVIYYLRGQKPFNSRVFK